MTEFSNKYDLEERIAKLGENAIILCKRLKINAITAPIINQLVRSSTSIGANYMEANGVSSRRDFANKISICRKETQETKHWFRMLAECFPAEKEEIKKLWSETQELTLIFSKIFSSLRK